MLQNGDARKHWPQDPDWFAVVIGWIIRLTAITLAGFYTAGLTGITTRSPPSSYRLAESVRQDVVYVAAVLREMPRSLNSVCMSRRRLS
ncbi:MAG: hypothetical protein ACLPZR_18865 [Solirubrobacteraceae bacterium]